MHERDCSFFMQELTTCFLYAPALHTVFSEVMGIFLSFIVTFERNPTALLKMVTKERINHI